MVKLSAFHVFLMHTTQGKSPAWYFGVCTSGGHMFSGEKVVSACAGRVCGLAHKDQVAFADVVKVSQEGHCQDGSWHGVWLSKTQRVSGQCYITLCRINLIRQKSIIIILC